MNCRWKGCYVTYTKKYYISKIGIHAALCDPHHELMTSSNELLLKGASYSLAQDSTDPEGRVAHICSFCNLEWMGKPLRLLHSLSAGRSRGVVGCLTCPRCKKKDAGHPQLRHLVRDLEYAQSIVFIQLQKAVYELINSDPSIMELVKPHGA